MSLFSISAQTRPCSLQPYFMERGNTIQCSPQESTVLATLPSRPLLPHSQLKHLIVLFFFVDLAIVLTLTYNVIIQKSQTINPVRCRHFPLLIGKLECDFERPAGGKVK